MDVLLFFPILLRKWEKADQLEAGFEAVRVANSVADSSMSLSSFSNIGCMSWIYAWMSPFNLPEEFLDALVHHVQPRGVQTRMKNWYRTADVVAVALAYYGSKIQPERRAVIELAATEAQNELDEQSARVAAIAAEKNCRPRALHAAGYRPRGCRTVQAPQNAPHHDVQRNARIKCVSAS